MDQVIVPMLAYEDGVAMMDWLTRVFGFVEKERWMDEFGSLSHGEIEYGGQIIMLASPSDQYESPNTLASRYPTAKRWLSVPYIFDGVLVYVEDLDKHFDRAKAEGAVILSPIEEGGIGRRYRAADAEGHRWFFLDK